MKSSSSPSRRSKRQGSSSYMHGLVSTNFSKSTKISGTQSTPPRRPSTSTNANKNSISGTPKSNNPNVSNIAKSSPIKPGVSYAAATKEDDEEATGASTSLRTFEPSASNNTAPRFNPPSRPTLATTTATATTEIATATATATATGTTICEVAMGEEEDKEKEEVEDDSSLESVGAWDGKCNETISVNDTIAYYLPNAVAGNTDAYRVATVVRVSGADEDEEYPLTLNTGHIIPDRQKVKRLSGIMPPGQESGLFRQLKRYQLAEGGTTTHGDVAMNMAGEFSAIHNRNMAGAARGGSGFAPMDMVRTLHGGNLPANPTITNNPAASDVLGSKVQGSGSNTSSVSIADINEDNGHLKTAAVIKCSSTEHQQQDVLTLLEQDPKFGFDDFVLLSDELPDTEELSMPTEETEECPASQPCDVTSLVRPGTVFQSFTSLLDTMRVICEQTGMEPSDLAYDAKDYFSKEDSTSLFGCETFHYRGRDCSFPKRGHFYCTKDGCLFFVPWTYVKKSRGYVIKPSVAKRNGPDMDLCLQHNHPVNQVLIEGYVYIKNEANLTVEEREFIENIALVNPGTPSIKEAMGKKFVKRDFCQNMLRRVANKARADHFGKDRHQLSKLREQGRRAIESGGVWKEHICEETWRLCGTLMQTSIQREFALENGSHFIELDGTHDTNMYGLIAIIHVTVDCCGRTVILGIATMKSEHSDGIVESAKVFGLSPAVPNDDAHKYPDEIDGIVINNRLAQNSEKPNQS